VAKADEAQSITITTARRRGESIQEVPASVTAISAASLERQQVQDLESLNLAVPNVTIVRNTGTNVGAQICIRGVGNDDSAFNIEPPVGICLDDVYIGRQVGAMLDLLDFERVEFLRGPQGTLYGRNSSAGAIKYVSRRPDLVNAGGSGAVTLGQRGRQGLNLSGNLPLVRESLALDFDLAVRKEDGWMKVVNATGADTGQRANALDSRAARLSGLWALDTRTDVLFSLDGSSNTSGPQVLASTNCSGLIGAGVAPTAPNSGFNVVCPFRFDARSSGQGAPDINKFRGQGGNTTVTRDLAGMEFKSVTAYRSFKDDLSLDLSGNPAAPFLLVQFLKQKQFSQEFQLSSRSKGPLNWIVGAFYFDETIDQNALFSGVRNIDTQKAKSYALFGEACWRFADAWTLTVGLRGSKDEKDIDRKFFPSAIATTPTATLAMGQSPYSENKTTPKLDIDFKASRDVLFYASYGEGYRAGAMRPRGRRASRRSAASWWRKPSRPTRPASRASGWTAACA